MVDAPIAPAMDTSTDARNASDNKQVPKSERFISIFLDHSWFRPFSLQWKVASIVTVFERSTTIPKQEVHLEQNPIASIDYR